jgi:hypothetical protein
MGTKQMKAINQPIELDVIKFVTKTYTADKGYGIFKKDIKFSIILDPRIQELSPTRKLGP